MISATGYGLPGEPGTLWPIQFDLWPGNDRAQWIWTGDNLDTAPEGNVRVLRREFNVSAG